MGVFKSSNPAEWDDVDGIIVDESAPPPSVQGVAANVALLIGQFQRGPATIQQPSSIGELHELYGKSLALGNLALRNKKFGALKTLRVQGAGAVKATRTFLNDDDDVIAFTAKDTGLYGNLIKVTILAGVGGTSTYIIEDTNPGSVLPKETFSNVSIATATAGTFATSKMVDVQIISNVLEPDPNSATGLITGDSGTVTDASYLAALEAAEIEGIANVVFLDEYNTIRNGYLKQHAANTADRLVVCAGGENDSLATSITNAAALRDTQARIIYADPWIQSTEDGVAAFSSPAPWVASIISQTPAHVDVASVEARDFMAGATGVKRTMNRAQFIQAKEAGIAAFENSRGYIKLKSGITTQIADSSKVTITRRRMADYLTGSLAIFLENYQNKVNKKGNRKDCAAGIMDFVIRHENEEVLPKDSEVKSGKAKLIDTESANTDAAVAAGFFKIIYKQRIFSSMRFIVLQAEIGESVVVTEA